MSKTETRKSIIAKTTLKVAIDAAKALAVCALAAFLTFYEPFKLVQASFGQTDLSFKIFATLLFIVCAVIGGFSVYAIGDGLIFAAKNEIGWCKRQLDALKKVAIV